MSRPWSSRIVTTRPRRQSSWSGSSLSLTVKATRGSRTTLRYFCDCLVVATRAWSPSTPTHTVVPHAETGTAGLACVCPFHLTYVYGNGQSRYDHRTQHDRNGQPDKVVGEGASAGRDVWLQTMIWNAAESWPKTRSPRVTAIPTMSSRSGHVCDRSAGIGV